MWDWLKKWWWAVVGAIGYGAYMIVQFFRPRRNDKLAAETREKVHKISVETEKALAEHSIRIAEQMRKLAELNKITDEKKRLDALADLTNKGGNE